MFHVNIRYTTKEETTMAKRKVFKSGLTSKAVIIPTYICELLGIEADDRLEITHRGEKIIITKVKGD